jgi:hypothetical protein
MVWLLCKMKRGDGFQGWYKDLSNTNTVTMIVVNLGTVDKAEKGGVDDLQEEEFVPCEEGIRKVKRKRADEEEEERGEECLMVVWSDYVQLALQTIPGEKHSSMTEKNSNADNHSNSWDTKANGESICFVSIHQQDTKISDIMNPKAKALRE